MLKLCYRDTLNYSPVDAVKGIDLVMKKVVMGDDPAPNDYQIRPMCKFCFHYKSLENHLGLCQKANYETYGDLWAKSCEDYHQNE